jgi:hypothetical protein
MILSRIFKVVLSEMVILEQTLIKMKIKGFVPIKEEKRCSRNKCKGPGVGVGVAV